MKILGNLLLITAGAVLFAAIWTPALWLQLLLTGLLLFFAGTALLGKSHPPQPAPIPHEELGTRKLTGPPPPPAKRPNNTVRRPRF